MTNPTPKQRLIEAVKKILTVKPKQYTFIYCDCGNEMCSDGSFVSDSYDAKNINHVIYKCKKCGLEHDYDFDFPAPIKHSNLIEEILPNE